MNRKPGIVLVLSVALGLSLCVSVLLAVAVAVLVARLPPVVHPPAPVVAAGMQQGPTVAPRAGLTSPRELPPPPPDVKEVRERTDVIVVPPPLALARKVSVDWDEPSRKGGVGHASIQR